VKTNTDTFTFARDMPLSAARMWHLMTDPDMRSAWSAPGDTTLTLLSSDLRIGGTDHHRCGPEDAAEFEVATRWYHLAEPTDAVFTEVIEAGGMALGASLVTYRIADAGKGSQVIITVAVTSFVGPEMIAEFKGGWTGAFDNLEKLAQETS